MEREILEYKIVYGTGHDKIAREVSFEIGRGWQPYGDPIYSTLGGFHQAMVKYGPSKTRLRREFEEENGAHTRMSNGYYVDPEIQKRWQVFVEEASKQW